MSAPERETARGLVPGGAVGARPVTALRCECCGTPMGDAALGADDEGLSRCPECRHVVRDVALAAGARDHAWGGRSAFDRLRLALTWRSRSAPT